MRNLAILGVVLVILGVGGLLLGQFSYTETKPVLDVGPIHVTSQEDHRVPIPTILGVVVLLAGVGLIIVGRRAA